MARQYQWHLITSKTIVMNCPKLLPVLTLSFFIFSCNRSGESAAYDNISDKTEQAPLQHKQEEQVPVPEEPQAHYTDSSPAKAAKTIVPVDWDKKIIKTASLQFEVKDFKTYAEEVYKTVKQYGGYIAAEDQNQFEEKQETTITIKVPVDQFEPMVNQLYSKDVKAIERKITTDDVGSQIVDTKSRLEAKRAIHAKYLQFFKDAKNMEEVLRVQADINSLQENMESAAGRINYLNHQAAMSTIVLTFYQPSGVSEPQQTPSFLTRIAAAFTTGGNWLGTLLIGLVSIWPLLLPVVPGILLYRKIFPAKIKQPNA